MTVMQPSLQNSTRVVHRHVDGTLGIFPVFSQNGRAENILSSTCPEIHCVTYRSRYHELYYSGKNAIIDVATCPDITVRYKVNYK